MSGETVDLELEPEESFFAYHAASAWLLSDKYIPRWESWTEKDLRNALRNIETGANNISLTGLEARSLIHAVSQGRFESPVDFPKHRQVVNYLIETAPSNDDLQSDNLYYGNEWESARTEVLERDSYECVNCGMGAEEHVSRWGMDLHIHHITPLREFEEIEDANHPENLITLCASCHRQAENGGLEL